MSDVSGPSGPDLAWLAVEIGIRTCVEVCGYDKDSETADWVVADMKRRPFRVRTESPEGWHYFSADALAMADWLKETYRGLLGEWLLEAVRLECELWEAKIQLLEGRKAVT